MLNKVIEKANTLVECEQTMKLNAKATKNVLASLDNPPEPNAALKALFNNFGTVDNPLLNSRLYLPIATFRKENKRSEICKKMQKSDRLFFTNL